MTDLQKLKWFLIIVFVGAWSIEMAWLYYKWCNND